MKKIISMFLMTIASVLAIADVNDVVVGYSSKGLDRYADGSVVRDGECYALVYTKPGATFAGFKVDGTLVNPEADDVAAVAPLAKDGACRPVAFVLPADYVTKHAGETVAVYLLDTRCADGAPAGLKDGQLVRVNRYSAVPDAALSFRASLQSVPFPGMDAGAFCADKAADASAVPAPTITKVEVVGGVMRVHVAQTVGCVTYGLLGGAQPDALENSVAEKNQDGNDKGEIVLTMPIDKNAKFAKAAGLVEIEKKASLAK